MEPECFDAVGTASVVPVRLFVEEQGAAGTTEDRIQALVDEAEWVKGSNGKSSYVRLVIRLDALEN